MVTTILGGKEGAQAVLCQPVGQAEQAGRVPYDAREDRTAGVHHRFRFVCGMPLKEAKAALRVKCLACWETVGGHAQHCSWVTDLCVNKGTVYRLMQGARARWHIANETCNTLKNHGYPFAHHLGHGYQPLSVVCASLRMWAFWVAQGPQRCCPRFQAAWATWGSKRFLWAKMRALVSDSALGAMRQLLEALVYGLKKSAPTLVLDAS